MKEFNVIIYDPNGKKFVSYNIIPYFIECYKERAKPLKTFKEFKDFIIKEARYQFWARCQYEIILSDWPCQQHEEKWDVYNQIMMNINVITKLVMESI